MRIIFPNSVRINRGNNVIKELVKTCIEYEFTDLVILHENRGVPGKLVVFYSRWPHSIPHAKWSYYLFWFI